MDGLNIRPETIEEKKEESLPQDSGIGQDILDSVTTIQQVRPIINKWNLMMWSKRNCQASEEAAIEWEKNLC